jgi:predicted RNA-binding protein with PIN domain
MLIIDGYNVLFQYFRGGYRKTRLEEQRDEFLQVLEDYCTSRRKNALVFFDAEKTGEERPVRCQIKRGTLSILFTAANVTADDAIIEYLETVENRRAAKVITSDRVILNAAKRAHVATQTSESFVDEMEHHLQSVTGAFDKEKAEGISEGEVDAWMKFFGLDEKSLKRLIQEP